MRASIGEARLEVFCAMRHVEIVQIVDELRTSKAMSAPSVRRRDPGEWRTIIVWAASRSMVPVAGPSSASTTRS